MGCEPFEGAYGVDPNETSKYCSDYWPGLHKVESPWLVMELMENGSFLNMVQNSMVPLDIGTVMGILQDILKGLRYLHEAKPPLIHGSLSSTSILVDDPNR